MGVAPVRHNKRRFPLSEGAREPNQRTGTEADRSLRSAGQADSCIHRDLVVTFEQGDEEVPAGGTTDSSTRARADTCAPRSKALGTR